MSWGKRGDRLSFDEGSRLPQPRLWGGRSQGEQLTSHDNLESSFMPSVPANLGRTLEEKLEVSQRTNATSQQMLPHLCLVGSRGGGGREGLGTGGVVGIFNSGGHPSAGGATCISYC